MAAKLKKNFQRDSWVKQIKHEAIAESDVKLVVLPSAQYNTSLPKMAEWLPNGIYNSRLFLIFDSM
jgi:hypothetical protein